jgi:hypothetical protein
VLDARTGAVLYRIAVGVAPQAIAEEESSERVVVVNRGGAVVHPADDWLAQGARRLQARLPWLERLAPRPPSNYHAPGSVSLITLGE